MPKTTPSKTTPSSTADTETDSDKVDLVSIVFDEITFTVPRDADEWSTTSELARVKAVSTGGLSDWLHFIEELLGPAQWNVLLLAAPKRADLYRFIKTISETVSQECRI